MKRMLMLVALAALTAVFTGCTSSTRIEWGGKMAVKAMFILKQGLGRSRKYVDEKSQKITGPGKVEIHFGDGDPRAKRAGK